MDNHTRYVQQFEEALEASLNGREEALTARNYFDDKQWTEDEKAALRKRKQPIVWENLIKPKVEALCGMERQGRVDPKAWPRVPSKEDDANAATDALRYVESDQDLDIKKSKVFEDMLVEGEGAIEVTVRKLKNGIIDPYVVRIAYDRLYGDPHSSEPDRSDASFDGYITWMDYEQALKKWPDREDVLKATKEQGTSSTFDTMEDKPEWATWYDGKRNRVRVNTHYHLEAGVWHRCVFTLSGELEESKPSVFLDDEGNPENPLIKQAAYVDRDNDRYGIVRSMIPLQDEVNKRRSKFLHMVNNNRLRLGRSLEQNAEKIRKEYAKPDGVIVADLDEIQELGNAAKESGQFQLFLDTRASLKGNVGPNGYLSGKQGENQSGRAVLAQQQAGMTEMAPLLDNLRHFTIRMYRQIWNRIRQYWTDERWIRVTDDEDNVRFVGLNVTQGHIALQKIAGAEKEGKIPPEVAEQYRQQVQMDPAMMQPANKIGELDVDIDIDEVNETPTLQVEQFEQLIQLASSGMLGQPIPPEVTKMIIRASNLRDKQKLLEMLDQAEEQAQQPNPMQELQVRGAQAKVAVDETKAQKTQAETAQIAQNVQLQPMIEGMRAGSMGAPM